MASLKSKIDFAKANASSTTTCTPATVVALKELLACDSETTASKANLTARKVKSIVDSSKPRTAAATRASGRAASSTKADLLTAKDKVALATHVINVTIKSLGEYKHSVPAPAPTPSKQNVVARRGGPQRGSTSTPLSPLRARPLNRVTTCPSAPTKQAVVPFTAPHSTGCLSTVECARISFACLRAVKGPVKVGQKDFQLEHGMLTLIARLLALNMQEAALKEMRILKRRLDGQAPTAEGIAKAGLADLLEYRSAIAEEKLQIVISCQLQVLKFAAAAKNPSYTESLMSVLDESHPSSPLRLLSRLAKVVGADETKTSRHLGSLSQVILSLAPSVSSKEDGVAAEARLSVSPLTAFGLQSLAFKTQLRWWKEAKHHGDVDKDVLSPFFRCVRCLVRRQKNDSALAYSKISASFDDIMQLIRSLGYQVATSSGSPALSLYQVLGSTAFLARQYEDAHKWYKMLKDLTSSQETSLVRTYSISAFVVAVALKKQKLDADVAQLVREVLDGLEGCLTGTISELNELLESLSQARRSVVNLLMNNMDSGSEPSISKELLQLLRSFILRYPRFVLRWLGTPPGKDAPAKQGLQFEQRRQVLRQSINQTLDSALMLVKCCLQEDPATAWQPLDDVLQDCTSLLNALYDPAALPVKAGQLGSYYVKVSSLYYAKVSQLNKAAEKSKEASKQLLQALSRSIEVVKDRPPAEQEQAQLSAKLELFADHCRRSGRTEDAARTLRSICTQMSEEGVLSYVAASLATQSASVAWRATEKSSTLSRTLRTLARLDKSWTDWTFFLPEVERAAVLEHLMHVRPDDVAESGPLRLHDPSPSALLRLYTLEKYPIRRFRVLLEIYYQNLGDDEETRQIGQLVEQTLEHLEAKDYGEDVSLAAFMPHLGAQRDSIVALADHGSPRALFLLKKAVSTWDSLVSQCQTGDRLSAVLGDPGHLLDHLQPLFQYAGLRGEPWLQISILKLSSAVLKLQSKSGADGLVLGQALLAKQFVSVGSFSQALDALEQAKGLLAQDDTISRRVRSELLLAEAEYLVGVGNNAEAADRLSSANAIFAAPRNSWTQAKSDLSLMLATASFLQSSVALQSGDVQTALSSIRTSVRMLSNDWAKLEKAVLKVSPSNDSSTSDISSGSTDTEDTKNGMNGPRFWVLASPLLRSILHISSVYAHIGMFQETMYYADAAWKIAEGTESPLYKAQVTSWKGSMYLRAHKIDKARPLFTDVKDWMPQDACSFRVRLANQLGDFHRECGEEDQALIYSKMAEETANLLAAYPQAQNEVEAAKKAGAKARSKARTTRSGRAVKLEKPSRMVTAPIKGAKRTTTAAGNKSPTTTTHDSSLPRDVYQSSLLAAVFLSRAAGCVQRKDWAAACSTLEQVKGLPKLLATLSQEQVVMATSLIGQSMEQMIHDPVFSVMQDSTISFPAVVGCADRISLGDTSPAKPLPGREEAIVAGGRKEADAPVFADALKAAQDLLLQVHATAVSNSETSVVHKISAMLQSTIITLCASALTKSRARGHSGFASVAVDMARNIGWKREQRTLQMQSSGTNGELAHAVPCSRARRSSTGVLTDTAKFQKNYIELIPKSWSVVSMSLGNDGRELCIARFQSGCSPFVLRLPLERANSLDADSEVFDFAHGRQELMDIIQRANETSHSAKDFTAKEERNAWWAEREALDSRLRELLQTIETTWLGGFKGVFSQHQQRPELLARFQKNFQRVLDRCLPSRSSLKMRKRKKAAVPARTQAVTLDPRILDLFIGLGDPSEPDGDFDEALNDLLYFVVDVLQFHGERNAYDEIDFDAMVVETYDALRGYHQAVRGTGPEEGAHTVLVLDKALHAFPWESLPCMQGQSVSRSPSLAHLRRLLVDASTADPQSPQGRHYVSAGAGTYILNPSSDLTNTQAYFQRPFASLNSWTGLVKRAPEEEELARALSESEVLLYFGHGSGAQYIRGKTVRRLDKCRPVTFLMGCSSASLAEAGDFECYGAVWNYMMAGCPAVVGTLWDVTDRDIDRFAGRAFEEWGLFGRGTFSEERRGRGRAGGQAGGRRAWCEKEEEAQAEEQEEEAERDDDRPRASLAEAVARARAACRFRYLNAAAVVVYGIPAYIRR